MNPVADRIFDIVLFAMAGGLLYFLADRQAVTADAMTTLVGGLIGAVVMYLRRDASAGNGKER